MLEQTKNVTKFSVKNDWFSKDSTIYPFSRFNVYWIQADKQNIYIQWDP